MQYPLAVRVNDLMKTLWVSPTFMHPTTRGVQIRTLEMLRHLHRRHEIHYVATQDPAGPEGPSRALEYCTRAYPFFHRVPEKTSPRFWRQLAVGVFSDMPVAIGRFNPPGMTAFLERLIRREGFDCAVVDLTFAKNTSDRSPSDISVLAMEQIG